MGRGRTRRWLAVWLVLSACEPSGPAPPPGFDAPEVRARGRALYLEHCALCHGERADGRGPRRGSLSPLPPSFRDPDWRRRTGAARVYEVVRRGRRGTPMPAWRDVLSERETWDVTAYVVGVGAEPPP